jgi:eukaryotic-like serine/threonine-protein kinase
VAHDMGIVHRDLKPDNIMITKQRDGSDCVKVVDFGIAKAANVEAQKVTRTGLVVGTPEYMSPEQLAGDPLDGRSDIYSLGLVAFNMLTGHLPFPSETVQESMIMRLTDRPKRLGEMRPEVSWPAEVQEVMDRALQRDAAERYSSASEFGRALRAAMAMVPDAPAAGVAQGASAAATVNTNVPKTRVSEAPARAASGSLGGAPSRTPMLVGAAVGVLVLGGAGWMLISGRGTNRDTASATTTQPSTAAAMPAGRTSSATGTAQLSASQSPSAAAAVQYGAPVGSSASQRSAPRETTPVAATAAPSVTTPVSGQSYGTELLRLDESINDAESAVRAGEALDALKRRVTLASDSASVQFIEAHAAMFTVGAARGCSLMRRIKPEAIGDQLKKSYSDGISACE